MTLYVQIKSSNPVPNEQDKKRGYFYRFFAAKGNQLNDRAYEVNRQEYTRLNKNPYVVTERVKWKISGDLEDYTIPVHVGGPDVVEYVTIPGVLTQNKASIKFAVERIPALRKILTDPQELYIDETSGQ